MDSKTAFLLAVMVSIVLWALPTSNLLFELISFKNFHVTISDRYEDNLQYETLSFKKLGLDDAKSVLIMMDSFEPKEITSNTCSGETILSESKYEIEIKFDTMKAGYECELTFSSPPDHVLYGLTITANDLPRYDWSRSDQRFDPIFQLMGIIVIPIFGFMGYLVIKTEFFKKDVNYHHFGSISLDELTDEYGEGFTELDVSILKTIKDQKKDIDSIAIFLNIPKKDVKKRLKFMEKKDVLYFS